MLALEAQGVAVELILGSLVEKAAPRWEHSAAQSGVDRSVGGPFGRRKTNDDPPGGWWVLVEIDIGLTHDTVLRPDIAGWRRDKQPARPQSSPVQVAPDWVCEVLSPSTAGMDLGPKRDAYHAAGVGHYWLVDPERGLVQVMRHTPEGYLIVAVGREGQHLHLEPFDAIELSVDDLLGRD